MFLSEDEEGFIRLQIRSTAFVAGLYCLLFYAVFFFHFHVAEDQGLVLIFVCIILLLACSVAWRLRGIIDSYFVLGYLAATFLYGFFWLELPQNIDGGDYLEVVVYLFISSVGYLMIRLSLLFGAALWAEAVKKAREWMK